MGVLDFSRRADTPELMDVEACPFEDFRGCLTDLARVNQLTLTHRPTLAFLDRLVRAGRMPTGRALRLLDVASGYGDLLRLIDRWADRRGVAVELVGIDLNPWAARAAGEATPPGRPIRWVTGDAFDVPGDEFDVILSSQFTHHLDDAGLTRFLAWQEATASVAWFVADLHRHPVPYHVFKFWSWAAGWHRYVRHDGPVSVTRALTLAEWRRAIAAAGLDGLGVELRWRFPFRITVTRIKPA
jgi:SAM-dependent methyltransferase